MLIHVGMMHGCPSFSFLVLLISEMTLKPHHFFLLSYCNKLMFTGKARLTAPENKIIHEAGSYMQGSIS